MLKWVGWRERLVLAEEWILADRAGTDKLVERVGIGCCIKFGQTGGL